MEYIVHYPVPILIGALLILVLAGIVDARLDGKVFYFRKPKPALVISKHEPITIADVRLGFSNGKIHLIKNPDADYGTVCQIGVGWFYLDDEDSEKQSPEEYYRNHYMNDVVDKVYESLQQLKEYARPGQEYRYYAAVLHEKK